MNSLWLLTLRFSLSLSLSSSKALEHPLQSSQQRGTFILFGDTPSTVSQSDLISFTNNSLFVWHHFFMKLQPSSNPSESPSSIPSKQPSSEVRSIKLCAFVLRSAQFVRSTTLQSLRLLRLLFFLTTIIFSHSR